MYIDLVKGDLQVYFPEDFDMDLNGRTLPWEAACLIPFADENLFIKQEVELLAKTALSEHNKVRNTVSFDYQSFTYDRDAPSVAPLASTLTKFNALPHNFVRKETFNEYGNVG